MPAGAPPPRGRMAQAGRPAGAHILDRGADRHPLWGSPGKTAARPAGTGRPAREGRTPALRPRGGGRWSGAPRLRPPGRQEGGRAAPPRTVRVSRLQSEPRAEGSARSGDRGEAGMRRRAGPVRAPRVRAAWRSAQLKLAGAPSERSLCRRRPRRGRRAGGGHRGAWGEGAVERGAWGRAAAARRRGGGRGSRAPPPVPTAPAAEPPPSARPPLRALAPASRSGSQLRPPGPAHVTRFPAPGTGARVPCPPRLSLSVPPRGGPARRAGLCRPGRHQAGPRQPLPRPQRVRPGLTLGKARRGRGLRLDRRRAPPDGVATVTGWHAKQFAVPTRLRVSPADPESRFGEEGGCAKSFLRWSARKGHAAARGGREGPLLGFLLFPLPGPPRTPTPIPTSAWAPASALRGRSHCVPAQSGASTSSQPSPSPEASAVQAECGQPLRPAASGPGPDPESPRDEASRTPCHPPLAGPLPGPALPLFPASLRPLVRLRLETADGGPLSWEK